MNLLVGIGMVAAGGFLGGLARWGLAQLIPARGGRVATWAANILASFFLGLTVVMPPEWALAAGAGLAGAMSTMSTFARELADLIEARLWREFWVYLLLTVLVGVVAAWRGTVWGALVVNNWVS